MEIITTSKEGGKLLEIIVRIIWTTHSKMAILTGNVIRDRVERIVNSSCFGSQKEFFKAVCWTYQCAWPGESFSWKIQISNKACSHQEKCIKSKIRRRHLAPRFSHVMWNWAWELKWTLENLQRHWKMAQ